MKKIIALLLTMLMVLGAAAVAEEALDTALVSRISNVAIELTQNGETTAVNLGDLEAYLSIDTADGLALVAQVFGGDDSLALAVAKLVDTQLHLAIDGVDATFAADVPQLQGQDTAALGEMLRPALPALLNYRLPKIAVPSLPQLDLTGMIGGSLGADNGDGTVSFSVPSEMVDGLLDQVLELAKSGAASIPYADQVIGTVEQLRASGMSVALEGVAADEGDKQTLSVSVYPVSNGETADAPVANVNLASAQDEIALTVDVPSGDEFMTVADLNVTTDSAANSFAATLDIAGMMQFNLGAYQEDDLQKAALSMESGLAGSFAVALAYGDTLTDLTFAVGEDVALEVSATTETASDAVTAGQLEIIAAVSGDAFHLTADIEAFLGDLELGDFTMPEEIVPIDQLSSETYSEALQTAFAPLIEYLNAITPDAA